MTVEADEAAVRAELADLDTRADSLLKRARVLRDMLDGPRVIPVLCFWQHHSYCEEESYSDTVEEAFGVLEAMEEHGTASTVGVRIGGYLIDHAEWEGDPSWRGAVRDQEVRAEADRRHHEGRYRN